VATTPINPTIASADKTQRNCFIPQLLVFWGKNFNVFSRTG